jgi:threonine/homoserine/homoserine lactone efflux protein
MELSTLAVFAGASAGLAFLPGPNTLLTVSRTISQGRRAGTKVLLGVELGFFVHLTAASAGLTGLLLAIPTAFNILRFGGAAYLLYLAWKIIRNGNSWDVNVELQREATSRLIAKGFFSNALNPKTAVFYVAIFPQFINPHAGSVLQQTFLLGIVHIAVSSTCNMIYVLGAGTLTNSLRKHPAWERAQRWLMGTLIGFLAIKIMSQRRLAAHSFAR